jgi:hypothetical protein
MPVLAQRASKASSIRSVSLPAPTGGINRVAPAGELPARDCLSLYNMVPGEYGCLVRSGSREWVRGIEGPVRSHAPFSGSLKNGAADRLFVVSTMGIWDASASTPTPDQPVVFTNTTGDAGWGVPHAVQTEGGHFLLYADEENGLHYYSENSDTWTAAPAGVAVPWLPATDYEDGDHVVNGGNEYACDTDGTSAGSGGPTGTSPNITDGSTQWDYVGPAIAGAIGPSLDEQRLGHDFNPANVAAVAVWKSRVWLIEKDSAAAWYGDVNSFLGTFDRFDFGLKAPHGGRLLGLFNWSYDAGGGLNTHLVGIFSSGDIVIYSGTDPTTVDTFGLTGCWFVGGVPAGRRIATEYGGDVLILSTLGVIPLSKLVAGQAKEKSSQYTTFKVQPIFNFLVAAYGREMGWGMYVHPTDNVLLIATPEIPGQGNLQLAMSLSAMQGWGVYRDLPMLSAGVWNGKLYFGTSDGRVLVNDGQVDGVTLADPSSFTLVNYSLILGYRDMGSAAHKRVKLIEPTILSGAPDDTVEATALYGYNLLEPPPPSPSPGGAGNAWDEGAWDVAVWGGDYTATQPLQGSGGVGRDVAIAIRGAAKSRTILTGVRVYFDTGGMR